MKLCKVGVTLRFYTAASTARSDNMHCVSSRHDRCKGDVDSAAFNVRQGSAIVRQVYAALRCG